MKSALRNFGRMVLLGLGLGLGIMSLPAGYAAIPLFTGVSSPNPIQGVPATLPDFQTTINNINGQIANWVTFNGGAPLQPGIMELLAQAATVGNGSVATAMSSVGPSGSHTTVQEWMVVVTVLGNTRYIPMF